MASVPPLAVRRIVDGRLPPITPWTFFAVRIAPAYGATKLAIGTSSFISFGEGHFLVTNLHNVTGRRTDTGLPISRTGGVPDRLHAWFLAARQPDPMTVEYNLEAWVEKVYPLYDEQRRPRWLVHPRWADVDIACVPFAPAGGAFPSLSLDNYVPPDDVRGGDPIHVLGYPLGISAYQHLPIWTRGSVASEFHLDFRERPRFLIDCMTRPGNSGSPVVGYTGHTSNVNGFGYEYQVPELRVLGVYSGRIRSVAARGEGETFDELSERIQDSGLGQVWKLGLVREIIEGNVFGSVENPPPVFE